MKTNNFRLPLYIIIIAIIQLMINTNSSKLYLDLLGLVIVIIILSNNYTFKSLIIISIIADLIGHWYLGTHLIAAISLTFISTSTTNFFNISTFLHKCIMLMFFTAIFLLVMLVIDLVVHNTIISPISFIIEVAICAPLLLRFLEKILIKHTQDIIF